MRNAHGRTWSMARKVNIMENEKHTLQDVKYGKKTENHGKRENPLDDLKKHEITEKLEK